PIKDTNTPSTSTPYKDAYTIFVSEHIQRVLSNRDLRSQMYFRPGVEAEIKLEFWHGNIWQESPFFSPFTIQINQAIVSTSNGIKLKVQLLYFGSELPRVFTSSARIERSRNGELWLSETTYLINPSN
ncbi:16454_t:CDS:2, partial [Gigaspora margarita]